MLVDSMFGELHTCCCASTFWLWCRRWNTRRRGVARSRPYAADDLKALLLLSVSKYGIHSSRPRDLRRTSKGRRLRRLRDNRSSQARGGNTSTRIGRLRQSMLRHKNKVGKRCTAQGAVPTADVRVAIDRSVAGRRGRYGPAVGSRTNAQLARGQRPHV